MMMAHDSSSPPSGRLDRESIAALSDALRAYLENGQSPSPLQGALRLVATEAKQKGMLAEQLLLVLKDVWGSIPEVKAMRDNNEQVRLLQRVVTICIKEYYSV